MTYLVAGVGGREKHTGNGSAEAGSLAWVAEGVEGGDGRHGGLLLAEASLDDGQEGDDGEVLGHGDGGIDLPEIYEGCE